MSVEMEGESFTSKCRGQEIVIVGKIAGGLSRSIPPTLILFTMRKWSEAFPTPFRGPEAGKLPKQETVEVIWPIVSPFITARRVWLDPPSSMNSYQVQLVLDVS